MRHREVLLDNRSKKKGNSLFFQLPRLPASAFSPGVPMTGENVPLGTCFQLGITRSILALRQ